jgi:hypothetical protein
MSANFRFKNHLLLAALAAAYPVLGHTAAAARIEFATGNVVAVSSAGQRPLARGAELNAGETINTGDGRAQLRFADGAMMSLQPQTEFRIDDYSYGGKNDGTEKGFFSLLRGGLRTITGYIGKGNRDNYKVTTSVATIGIRGTEWSGSLTPGSTPDETQLNLGTGEGAIEVCNAGGCIVVASGESAIVTGDAQPRRTDVRPSLPPSSIVNPPPNQEPYSVAEERAPDGGLVIVENNQPPPAPSSPKFTTGSNYAAAASGLYEYDGSYFIYLDQKSPTNVTFVDGQVVSAQGTLSSYTNPASIHDVDTKPDGTEAVLGWGRWTGGTATYYSDYTLVDAHYVVGVPTSDDQIKQISGSYNYTKVGGTTPTYTNGSGTGTGTLNSASLNVTFNGVAGYTTSLSVNVTAGNKDFNVSGNGNGSPSTTSTFSGSGMNVNSDSLNYKGLLAGSNAKFAGVAYSLNGGGTQAHGAIGFTKGGMVAQ